MKAKLYQLQLSSFSLTCAILTYQTADHVIRLLELLKAILRKFLEEAMMMQRKFLPRKGCTAHTDPGKLVASRVFRTVTHSV